MSDDHARRNAEMAAQIAAASPWRSYRSHRVVRAAQITGVGLATSEDTRRVLFVGSADNATTEVFEPTIPAMIDKTAVGDYAMWYDDDYKSVCPKLSFETAYTLIEEH